MKSTEVYALLRTEIAPWAKVQGFKRTKSALGWTRPHGTANVDFWFQITRDGWDPYAGSRFTVNFTPVTGRAFTRIGHLLDDEGRERLRQIQNRVIASLQPPPKDYYALQIDAQTAEWYRRKFRPIEHPYSSADDVWLRYHEPEHVLAWGRFLLEVLPSCIRQVEL